MVIAASIPINIRRNLVADMLFFLFREEVIFILKLVCHGDFGGVDRLHAPSFEALAACSACLNT
jgi:hypothetical protein